MGRLCLRCGAVLNQYNPGKLCFPCQKNQLEQRTTYSEELIDAENFAFMLGLTNAESVKRLARKGKLPPRIPGIYKWLWRRSIVEYWIKQEGIGSKELRITARGIASNLRRCSNDSIIYTLSNTIESKVYGQEDVLGTTDTGRVEPIKLVRVDKTIALKMLEKLSKEDFPELISVTDWENLHYDRITEDLIVRLEAYF